MLNRGHIGHDQEEHRNELTVGPHPSTASLPINRRSLSALLAASALLQPVQAFAEDTGRSGSLTLADVTPEVVPAAPLSAR